MQRKMKKKQAECPKHRWKEAERRNGKIAGYECVLCGAKSKDMTDDPNVLWSLFRCQNLVCNQLLEDWDTRNNGFCTGCQGNKFVIATYLTDQEKADIDNGKIKPKRINLEVVGIEPEGPREAR